MVEEGVLKGYTGLSGAADVALSGVLALISDDLTM